MWDIIWAKLSDFVLGGKCMIFVNVVAPGTPLIIFLAILKGKITQKIARKSIRALMNVTVSKIKHFVFSLEAVLGPSHALLCEFGLENKRFGLENKGN